MSADRAPAAHDPALSDAGQNSAVEVTHIFG
jgi:hypothetical protein